MRRGLLLSLLMSVFVVLAVEPSAARQDTLHVTPDMSATALADAVARSSPGDVIMLTAGSYVAEDLAIPHDLTLVGEGEVVLMARVPVRKALLVPLHGTSITIRGVTFEGARSPDRNGAGIRFEGTNLVIDDCIFRDNENGVLTANGIPKGRVTVTGSRFANNGHGDGYSHGIYQSSGARLEVRDSTFEGTRIGHHLKSLASLVIVSGNRFDDQSGRTSYVVDVTAGGDMIVTDNDILRRRSASQRTLFNYDTTRGGEAGTITITNNRLVTERPGVILLRNPERAPATVKDNQRETRGRGSFRRGQ